MRSILILLVIQFALSMAVAEEKNLVEKETIQRTLFFDAAAIEKRLIVDNVFGSIHVKGHRDAAIELKAQKTISARSSEKIELAKKEVQLDITNTTSQIELYVNGPFRKRDGSVNYRGWRFYGYQVSYDFELTVPNEIALVLKTINEGQITVRQFQGIYDVENINGGIEMQDINGAGRIYALNDDVAVVFQKNPESECYIGTLNGELRVYFNKPLAADFWLKTFNGEVYSDFQVIQLPKKQVVPVKRDGKNIYKSEKGFCVRCGQGGPEITLDAFNGDIHILENKN